MKYEQKMIYQILLSIQEKQYIKNYELNISPMEFYALIMDLVDQELIINIPDPEYKNDLIVFFEIKGAILTIKGKEMLDKFFREVKVMNSEIFIVHGHDEALKIEVARTIERAGLDVTILHEKPNEGRL